MGQVSISTFFIFQLFIHKEATLLKLRLSHSSCQLHFYSFKPLSPQSEFVRSRISGDMSSRMEAYSVTSSNLEDESVGKNEDGEENDTTRQLSYRYLLARSKLPCNIFFLLFPSKMGPTSRFIAKSGFAYSQTVIFYVIETDTVVKERFIRSWEDDPEEFPSHTAPLALLTFATSDNFPTSFKLGDFAVLCYTCSDKFINIWDEVDNALEVDPVSVHKQWNWVGRGVKGFMKAFNTLDASQLDVKQFPRLLECEIYFDSEERCIDMLVLWQILQTRLNFTLVQVDDYFESLEEPSLKICMDCFYGAEHPESHSLVFYADGKNMHFIYCEVISNLQEPSWLFFLEPFDSWIWVGIVSSGVVLSFVGRDLGYLLFVFLVLINQPMSRKLPMWGQLALMATTVLSYQYQCFMTTNVIPSS